MARCAPDAAAPQRTTHPFPSFPGEPPVRGPIKRSRMGRRRAIVLALIHVAVILHVVHWKLSGSTLSPVEPSESMRTLELGELNAGFLFFAVAIVATAVLGRFFCGWGCHLVALQDLCSWAMKKAGIRPRPFRSRLLFAAPLVFAVYMFVWPSFKRAVLLPGLAATGLDGTLAPAAARLGLDWFGDLAPFPGFTNHLATTEFWATFPGWAIAVPFLAICGFLTVWLLGAKGFCTYGCPYGGFFAPAEALAPGRIRVDENCDGCGHCTAVCTSNVRVHAEVRAHGMVTDPGCMKCLDCVDTCPKDALRFGFGRPAAFSGGGRRAVSRHWDVSGGAEIALAVVFGLSFFAWRGAYDAIPFLMAIGMAASVTYLTWLLARLVRSPEVEHQGFALRRGGLTGRGVGTAAGAIVAILLTAQAGAVRFAGSQAVRFDREVPVGRGEAFAADRTALAPEVRDAAERAATWYARADVLGQGGLGLAAVPGTVARRAWMALVLGRHAEAETQLRRLAERDGNRGTRLDIARVQRADGRADEAAAGLRTLIAEDPTDVDSHRELAATLMAIGDREGAVAALVAVVNLAPEDATARRILVGLLEQLGRPADAARYR